ncbi:DNA polymerase I [Plasticicumulans lactativorans]|uniref:DNA polymerase I n=1 Tax=Plasticicumulans lactativorans TaxID=1133106 RepID=A0A4R2L7R2_9GAMM|nr:DNA polymerase I [Plasticicumulans lactativorans]TCO82686.1 DNA polymerase I [Plasticicumulans lactativorans]
MTATPPLLLVDGSSYLYRAYHALPPLTTAAGEPTGAMRGVVMMLRNLVERFAPSHAAVVFDASGPTFRDALYPDYKAHRPPMPDDLRAQVEPLHAMVRALGLPLLAVPGVEADDVIGTLARDAAARGLAVVVATGDKDLAQLVDARITLLDTMKRNGEESVYDRAGVLAKFGVPPEAIVDLLALMGDSVDNIPGLPGVGPKTAARWLAEYGSLDALVANAGAIKGKAGDTLRAHLGQLPLARALATIRCDVPLEVGFDGLAYHGPERPALLALYRRYEFNSLLRELEAAPAPAPVAVDAAGGEAAAGDAVAVDATPADPPAKVRDYDVVVTAAAFAGWLARLEAAALFAFDTETTSLDYMQAEIVGVSFAVEPHRAAYVPLAHVYPAAPEQLDRAEVLAALRPLLEDPARAKVGQHLKYDWHVLRNHGVALAGIAHDTMLESYVLDSTATRHDMDSLAARYLGETTIHYEQVAGKGAKQIGFEQVPIDAAGEYAAEDADVTLRLHQALWPRLEAEPRLAALYRELEIPLVPVLARMEDAGVRIDPALLRRQSGEIAQRLLGLERQAHGLAGQPFNLGSPKQLQAILFDQLGLPVKKKTPTGQPSTDEEVLEELAAEFELPRVILEHRSLSKLRGTYTDKLPALVNPRTGRVHTSYHQAVASTGRLSSSDPNLQNIPVRTEEGRRIRQAFVAPPGTRIVAADYSQIELRIMAHLSGDERLRAAFAQGEDVHRATAAEVFGVPLERVGTDQRRAAKAINFGLIYGMSAFGLARQLGIGRGAAQEYVERYFARYPGVKAFMDRTRGEAAERGYVETVFGRRLYLPDIRSKNPARRAAAERTAINAPMQGTAADVIKRAMLAVDAWLQGGGAAARMIMQVHDELVFEVAADAVEAFVPRVRELMSAAAALSVPLDVDVGVGDNWEEAH